MMGNTLVSALRGLSAPLSFRFALLRSNTSQVPSAEQLIQPLRLRPLFESHVPCAAHAPKQTNQRSCFRRHDRPRYDSPAFFPHRPDCSILVHIEEDILRCAFHESRPLL
jgi:hypothetical protein